MKTIEQAFADSAPRPPLEAHQSEKKNYGERLSRNIAWAIADGLRSSFPGILPTSEGTQQESKARTPKGFKKLDVNYSTPQLGLALGVSVKSINFVDKKTRRGEHAVQVRPVREAQRGQTIAVIGSGRRNSSELVGDRRRRNRLPGRECPAYGRLEIGSGHSGSARIRHVIANRKLIPPE